MEAMRSAAEDKIYNHEDVEGALERMKLSRDPRERLVWEAVADGLREAVLQRGWLTSWDMHDLCLGQEERVLIVRENLDATLDTIADVMGQEGAGAVDTDSDNSSVGGSTGDSSEEDFNGSVEVQMGRPETLQAGLSDPDVLLCPDMSEEPFSAAEVQAAIACDDDTPIRLRHEIIAVIGNRRVPRKELLKSFPVGSKCDHTHHTPPAARCHPLTY